MRSLTRILRFTSQLWKFYLGVVISAVIVAITQLAVPFVIAVRGNDHHIRDIMLLAVVTSSSTSSTPCSPTSTDGWATS